MIRVYDDAGNVIETHEHKGKFALLRVNGTVHCNRAPGHCICLRMCRAASQAQEIEALLQEMLIAAEVASL